MGLEASAVAVIRREPTFYGRCLRSLPTDPDAMMKAMKNDSLWMDSIDIATTLFV
jgi:hypothetical protein